MSLIIGDAAELMWAMDQKVTSLEEQLAATRAALEQRTRERDEARAQTSELLPIADAHDWALGEMQTALNRAAKAEAELSSLRESAAALGELEKWLREDDHRVVWLGQVIGDGECSCVLYISDEEYEQDDEIGREKGNTLADAIRAALKAAEGAGK